MPFLNKVRTLNITCSFRDGFIDAMKLASRFLRSLYFVGALHKMDQLKLWLGLFLRCLAGSESLFGFSCSFHLTLTFRIVSPTYVSLQFLHSPKYILVAGYGFFSFRLNNWRTFLVFQVMTTLNLRCVKSWNLVKKRFATSSFFWQ